ncbi:patatin-like phospholipase family protein [Methylocapsa aurea]|uniref:patatin-like phospholipase family protein n=1 Tax=Methylocapsa aurea TaxID=663610 RepID=UPI00068A044E|nr:patatin-like phospholipase family protein [Methylocapsa aurea]
MRGDHDYVDACQPDELRPRLPPNSVTAAENVAINERRQYIRDNKGRDRTHAPFTGLALSGGGIRSASFGLGTLQALHAHSGIEGIDYLSTVSGGGYIGCAMTAAMQSTKGDFPFTNPKSFDDTASVRHIRDFSNYLIPHGLLDVATAIGIIARGLVANALIILPILLFFVWITLVFHPTVDSLDEPKFLIWNLADGVAALGLPASKPLWGLHGYWFTLCLGVLNVVFLIFWAFAKSISTSHFWRTWFAWMRKPGDSAELNGGLVAVSKALFFATLLAVWFETQPFILLALTERLSTEGGACSDWALSSACFGAFLETLVVRVTPYLASIGAIFAYFSKNLTEIIAAAKRATGWRAWFKKIAAKAALWFAAIVVPFFLWLLYIRLTFIGLRPADAPDWLQALAGLAPQAINQVQDLAHWAGETVAARLYFVAFGVSLIVALFINPNATSLHRLYRDRLSKAFLFDAEKRDPHGDLEAAEPELHQIDVKLSPYPIINASLNIEGSQYANKRGRNADFFIFSPEYTGSDATGYVGTKRIEAEETALDLGTAMAISGAAISANMGSATIRPLTLTLALLNIRLGYWLRNPKAVGGARALLKRMPQSGSFLRFTKILGWITEKSPSFLLIKEMFSWITEVSPTVYLTDGGNLENLGLYSLMKRRCQLIIVIDAEADPTMGFGSLLILERYARIDLGAIIELPWQAIRDGSLNINKAFDKADADGSAIPCLRGPHCAAGEIQYGPNEKGILLYVKASLSGDEDDYLLDYKRRNRAFPHETTGDQFFSEEQLEAYRALGFHIMKGLLTGDAPFAVTPRPGESEDQARKRIQDSVIAGLKPEPRPI